ncbi:MAG TPA: cbb3-type cytochrome c oxidase subunit I [Bryobacteraceae bacterium]|nr:cbb3-type cytochrome c oxidase subunit I [Bryobacteraceae bacterium]
MAEQALVHEPAKGFIRKYVFSTDHKVIGIQYYVLALFSVLLGMVLSIFMRLRLAWPMEKWPLLQQVFPTGFVGGPMTPEFYLSMMTMHGTIMVFFVLTTAPLSGFGNYFLPIQIGARDMAFPVLNMLSFWVTLVSLLVMVAALFVTGGAPIAGWTSYAPLSALGEVAGPGLGLGQTLWIISIAIFCVASLLTALNFLTTTLNLRARGMSLLRMPLTVWAWFTTAMLALLAFPVLLAGGILLMLDRVGGTSFFIPGGLVVSDRLISAHTGGSPLLWQHLFWFFGHPEVYIAILPGMGITSHVLSTFSRKPIFAYKAMVLAIFAIGFISYLVWGHHMFMSGMSPYSSMAFSITTLAVGVPSAIKTFNWLATLRGGRIRLTASMLFALGFVSLFVSGGVTGMLLAQPVIDIPLHDTYFVVAHFHIIMGVAAVFGIFAGTYYWFPKMFGRMLNERLGKIHFWFTIAGVYAIFMPMHFLGIAGAPRRYAQLTEFEFLTPLQALQVFISVAAFITIAAQLIFLFNFIWSLRRGKRAGANPWASTSLEWTVPSPPPHDNFGAVEPVVFHGPYEYSVPNAPEDYVMQSEPVREING